MDDRRILFLLYFVLTSLILLPGLARDALPAGSQKFSVGHNM